MEGQLEGLTDDLRDAVLSLHVSLGVCLCDCMGCGNTDSCVYDGQVE